MKIAITAWQGRVSPVFDVSGTLIVMDSKEPARREELALRAKDPLGKLQFLQDHGIGQLICGAITRRTREQAAALGISVSPFVSGSIDEVLRAWRNGTLMKACYSMPGCRRCRRRQRRCGDQENNSTRRQ